MSPSKSIWNITGKYSIENPYVNIKGNSSDVDLNSWIAMMLPERGIKVIKGKATADFLIRASSDELEGLADKLFFNGNFNMSDTDIRIPEVGTDIQNINLSASATKKSLILDKCTGFLFGAPFSITGDIADFSSKSLNFNGKVSNINHDRILKNSFVKSFGVNKFVSGGSSELKFNVGGTIEEPKLTAILNGKKINTNYGELASYSVEAEATKNSVYLSSLKGLFEGIDMKAHGWFFPTTKKVLLFASGNGYPYFLPSTVNISSAGFNAVVFGPIDNLTVSGDLKGYGVSAMGNGLGNIDSGFLFADNSVYLPDLYINGNGGSVKSSAVYDLKDSKFNASVDANNFAVNSSGVLTSVSGTASVFGDPTNPVASGNLNIPNLNFNQYSISNINVPVAGNSDIVDFSATGQTMGMNFRTGGQVSPSDKQVSASFEVSNIDSSSFSHMVPKGMDIPEFKGSLSGSLAGSDDYGCFFVSNIFGNYTDNEKDMTRLIGKFGGLVKNDENKSLIAYADVQNPTVKLPDKGVYTAFQGNVDQISAIASGSFEAISLLGTASFSNASVAKIPVSNANLEVNIDKKGIDIRNIAVNGEDGSLYITSNNETDLIANLSAVNVNSLLNKADLTPFGIELGDFLKGSEIRNLQGLAYLRAKLKETENSKYRAFGQFFIPDAVLGHEKFSLFSSVSFGNDILALKHFDLSIGSSNFAGVGQTGLNANSPISFDIKATRGNIEKLLAISSFRDIPVSGRFDGDLHISGTVKNIAIDGNVVV
ncbi:translocation/assembly module TamB domain-containing protein, partial [bacterium]|nr:translocation/assembly module TamB domain-containing protein [bacterium]